MRARIRSVPPLRHKLSILAGMDGGAANNLWSYIFNLLRHLAPPFPPDGVCGILIDLFLYLVLIIVCIYFKNHTQVLFFCCEKLLLIKVTVKTPILMYVESIFRI